MQTASKNHEMINSVDSENWLIIMQQEIKALIEKGYIWISVSPESQEHYELLLGRCN